MSSLSKTSFQEMTFLDEMIDQVIILDKSRNVCCANKSAFTRFGNDINGNDGIKGIKNSLPDLVLLDWMLPDFSGVEICKNLKKDIKF